MTEKERTACGVHAEAARALNAFGRPIYLKDVDERIVYANDDFLELMGYPAEQVLRRAERELLGNENADLLADGAARVLGGMERVVRAELKALDGADTLRLLDVRQRVYESAAGDLLVLVILRDVTEERHLEEVLKSSEEYSRSFLESSQDCIAHLVSDGSFLSMNDAGAKMFGFRSPAEVIGRAFETVCFDPGETCSKALLQAVCGEQSRFEQRVMGAQNRELWLDVRLTPIKDFDGSVRSILLVGRDITEQRQTETELRKLLRAVEQNPASIVITNTDGIIEYVNPKFCAVTGYSLEEAIGHTQRVLKSGEMPPEGYRDLWETILAGREWRGEFHNRKKDGTLYWEAASISPIRNTDGKVTHFIAVKEDITERKMLEKQLLHEKAQLDQAYADLKNLQSQLLQQEKMSSIGQLAAGVAHEINNPMGFIMSNLNTLRKYVVRLHGFINTQQAALQDVNASPSSAADALKAVKAERTALKIDFVLGDAGSLLAESLDGAERVKRIVQDLKGFSRIDEAESTMGDVNAGLESTINIVWNEI
ncbi:MAG TPA: PAS domain S-box protein, partial [Dissulfurispiraceae bacterium]|nr:PAS domain S-box protein [Dissulfurispiraceae bacterium]